MFIVWNAEIKPALVKAIEWDKAMKEHEYLVWLDNCQIFFNNLYEVENNMGILVRVEVAAMKDRWIVCNH